MFGQVADAVRYCHMHSVVHRDLKVRLTRARAHTPHCSVLLTTLQPCAPLHGTNVDCLASARVSPCSVPGAGGGGGRVEGGVEGGTTT